MQTDDFSLGLGLMEPGRLLSNVELLLSLIKQNRISIGF